MSITSQVLLWSYLVFANFVSASLIFHCHWRIKNYDDDNSWTQFLAQLWAFGKLMTIILNLNSSHLATWKVYLTSILLNPLHLDTFYFLKQKKYFPKYDLTKAQFYIFFSHVPLFLIVTTSSIKLPPTFEVIVPLIAALLAIFVALVRFSNLLFLVLMEKKEKDSIWVCQNFIRKLLLEVGITLLNFLTYYALIWINGYLVGSDFFAYFTVALLVLFSQFWVSFYKRERRQIRAKSDILVFSGVLMVIQLINFDIDFRILTSLVHSKVMQEVGQWFFDRMNFFSLMVKAFLISMLLGFMKNDLYKEKYLEIRNGIHFVLIASIVSLVINSRKYYQNVVLPFLNGTGVKDIFTVESLQKEFNLDQERKRNSKDYGKSQHSFISCSEKAYINSQFCSQLTMNCLLCGFEGSNIIFGCRIYRKMLIHGYDVVRIQKRVQFKSIMNSILRFGIISSIKVIQMEFHENWSNDVGEFIDFMEGKGLFIKIIKTRKKEIHSQLGSRLNCYNSFVDQVNSAMYSIMAFQTVVAPFQQFHSKSIVYDLYEN